MMQSPNLVICVASHIYYDNQLKLLDRCLDSLLSQTKKADVLVSISFNKTEYQKSFATDILAKYGKNIKFKFSKERKSQMEHLYNLMKWIKQYDLVLFCDDDDTYHEDRVAVFSDTYKNKHLVPSEKKHLNFAGIKELFTNKKGTEESDLLDSTPEFWAHGLVPSILEMFFARSRRYFVLLKDNFADMYFRCYLRTLNQSYDWIALMPTDQSSDVYYKYNEKNPDSICAKLEKMGKSLIARARFIHDQLLLATIVQNLTNEDSFQERKKYYHMNDEDVRVIFPEQQMVINLCHELYDMK